MLTTGTSGENRPQSLEDLLAGFKVEAQTARRDGPQAQHSELTGKLTEKGQPGPGVPRERTFSLEPSRDPHPTPPSPAKAHLLHLETQATDTVTGSKTAP